MKTEIETEAKYLEPVDQEALFDTIEDNIDYDSLDEVLSDMDRAHAEVKEMRISMEESLKKEEARQARPRPLLITVAFLTLVFSVALFLASLATLVVLKALGIAALAFGFAASSALWGIMLYEEASKVYYWLAARSAKKEQDNA